MRDEPRVRLSDERAAALVGVWRLFSSGEREAARERLLVVWHLDMDADVPPDSQESRVALRLFDRLGFFTDDPDEWATLPDPMWVFRTGHPDGVSWTTDLASAEARASESNTPVHSRVVQKADVLAYSTTRGEAEVIVRPAWIALGLVQAADAFEFALLDSEPRCEVGVVAPHLLDEALHVLAADEDIQRLAEGQSGLRRRSRTT